MFDYHQLAAFKIKPSKLPPGSIIINQPPSLYQQYQHAVWAGLAALFVQLIIIFFLASSILRRRRVEKAIHQNQKRLNMILETANEGFWEIDAFGIGVNVNAELCMILNRSRSEIVGHSILAFADAHNRSIFEEQLAKRRQGERSQYEIALQRPDGSAVHCQFNSSPLFSDSGLFTGAFSMVTDISKRKRDEDILKNREAMLQAIFESTDNAIAVIDDNGSLSKVNKRFKELFPPSGLTNDLSENQISLRKWMKPYIPQNEWPACLQYPMRAMGEEMVGRIRCCNGRVIDVSCFPLQWTTATFGGTVFSFRDITEKIRLESQLLQSQKMEALGTLTSGIAHDFNNILAAILGYTEILQYQFKHTPDALKKISRVLKAAHRAKDLVQQIHSFSRPQQIAPRPLCAGLMVKEVVKLLQASLPPDIKVQIDQRSKRDSVTVDPGQIHQVIMNLCTNAVHAMQEDGGLLTVVLDTVSFEYPKQLFDTILPGGEYLLLQVKDTGCGIPREIVQKIFDPYFTTKEKGQGTGLGLAVTLGIIKNHGGAIRVDSHEWQGSVFSVYLPLSKEAPSMEDAPLQPLPMGAGRIFLVDDEPEITAMMNEMLLHLGYQTTAFTDSQQALAAFNDHPEAYDIAIVDMIMPGISGPEIAEAIRDKRKDMPIFLCTGYSDPPVMDTAPMRLFNRCLTKPLELQELAEVLHKTLSSNNIAP
jgi:PAS domain S-box-containing protein